MGFTDLLDQLTQVGPKLTAASGELQDGVTADARNEVNAALLPVWQWLDGLKSAAELNGVDWVVLDSAPSTEAIEAVKGAIAILGAEAEVGNVSALTSELPLLGALLLTVADQTEERLRELGIDAERRNRLLLPLRAHVSELAVTRGSSEALSLVRQSLGKEGEERLSAGVEKVAKYEQVRGDAFRYLALIAYLVSIGWLIASYVAFRSPHISGSERVTETISRVAIGSVVLALAVYLSREASGHRDRAGAWRSVQLQMDTIDLYCASLPPEHRDAVRLAFGLEIFSGPKLFGAASSGRGNSDGSTSGGSGAVEPERAIALVRMLQSRVT